MIRKKQQLVAIAFSAALSMAVSAESRVDVITTIAVGTINMQLDITETFDGGANFSGDNRTLSINPKIPSAEIGVTVLDDTLYYGFTMQITGQSVARFDKVTFDSSVPISSSSSSQEVTSRTAYSVYSGYTITDSNTIYGGVTFGTGSYGNEVFIDEFGPFIGSSYALRFSSNTSLNFDLSISVVNIEATLNDTSPRLEHTITSTNRAMSYSATWLKALDRGRSFFVRLKIIDLVLDGSGTVTDISNSVGTATIKGSQVSTYLSLGMGF